MIWRMWRRERKLCWDYFLPLWMFKDDGPYLYVWCGPQTMATALLFPRRKTTPLSSQLAKGGEARAEAHTCTKMCPSADSTGQCLHSCILLCSVLDHSFSRLLASFPLRHRTKKKRRQGSCFLPLCYFPALCTAQIRASGEGWMPTARHAHTQRTEQSTRSNIANQQTCPRRGNWISSPTVRQKT